MASSAPSAGDASAGEASLSAATGRKALSAFFLLGLEFAIFGAILPAWGYHLKVDYLTVGHYFLAGSLGVLMSAWLGRVLLSHKSISFVMTLACGLACGALLLLSAVCPPVSAWWRVLGLFLLGASGGLLNGAVFQAIWPIYLHHPAATVNLAGILFGLGCLVTALLVAGTFYIYTVPSIIFFLAVIPGLFCAHYSRTRFPSSPMIRVSNASEFFAGFRSLTAILFTLLLFLQFGNEWSIAGWLAIFLTQRVGISPEYALFLLSLYWAFLLVGRIAVQAILPRVSHAKLLFCSAGAALLGCLILSSTDNTFGAISGLLFVACGFASPYPLLVEMIGDRFSYYHPVFFNGIFAVAFIGGLLAPASLGYYAEWLDIRVVMWLPLAGTCLVVLLLLLIWLEAKLSGPAHINRIVTGV